MKESQLILGWLREGKEKGAVEQARADLLKVARARLGEPVPEAVRLAVEGTNDAATLDRWLDAALAAADWAAFRAAMQQQP